MAYFSRSNSAATARTVYTQDEGDWEGEVYEDEGSSENDDGVEEPEAFFTEVKVRIQTPLPNVEADSALVQSDDTESIDSSSDYETDLEAEFELEPALKDLTGAALYQKLCEKIGIVPLSSVKSNMNGYHFDLPHRGIGSAGVKALAPPVTMNPNTRRLNLENDMIGSRGGEFIANIINGNTFITELNLSYNQLGSEGAAVLSHPIRDSSSLVHVSLSNNEFEDRDAHYFADIIENNISLRSFNLSKNYFSLEGGKVLGPALDVISLECHQGKLDNDLDFTSANNDTLEILDLSWNALRLEGAQALAKGLAANLGLKTLNLSMNGFSNDGTRAIGIALTLNKYLENLDLSFNRISNNAAADFARYFKINCTLRTLKLFGNPIMYDGCMEILKTISENQRTAVHLLDIKGLMVHQEFLDLATSMNAERPFKVEIGIVSHGKAVEGTIDRFADKNPLEILLIFMGEQGLRLVDLFRSFDKDQSGGLTRDEFINGLQEVKTPLTRSQLDELLDMLDKDGDGEIDLKEILNINREYRDIKMKAARYVQEEKLQKKLEKQGKKETEMGAFTKEALAMKQRSQTSIGITLSAPGQGDEADKSVSAPPQTADAAVRPEPEVPPTPAPVTVTTEEAAELNQQVQTIKAKGLLGKWKNKALV